MFKGGRNEKPTTPRPPRPQGQRPMTEDEKKQYKEAMKKTTYGSCQQLKESIHLLGKTSIVSMKEACKGMQELSKSFREITRIANASKEARRPRPGEIIQVAPEEPTPPEVEFRTEGTLWVPSWLTRMFAWFRDRREKRRDKKERQRNEKALPDYRRK